MTVCGIESICYAIRMARSSSLTERAYRQLRDDLLTCRHAPGDRLNIKEIADSQGVSLGAVREALSRLVSEGFVTADDRRGFRAAPISVAELRDLVAVRINIEGQCLRRSIEVGGLDWEIEVVSACHRLCGTPSVRDAAQPQLSEDFAAAHNAFHTALVSACDSIWLGRLRVMLYAQSERYRHLTVPLARQERDLVQEHRDLADAALARDPDRAVALLGEHLARTANILIEAETAQAA
jgi:DNA-binding GntR family transcriptional regulator